MGNNKLKIVSIVLMLLLTMNASWNLLEYVQTKFSMTNPLIPDHVVAKFSTPYLMNAAFSALAVAFSLPFFFRFRYKLTIGICIVAIIVEPVLIY